MMRDVGHRELFRSYPLRLKVDADTFRFTVEIKGDRVEEIMEEHEY